MPPRLTITVKAGYLLLDISMKLLCYCIAGGCHWVYSVIECSMINAARYGA